MPKIGLPKNRIQHLEPP